MSHKDLHTQFIKTLNEKTPHRPTLVNIISEILHIEKESASRRLNGKVSFSATEMGKLASEMEISLDGLLEDGDDHIWIPFTLEKPMKRESIDILCDILEYNLESSEKIIRENPEVCAVYHSMPLEFFIHHPTLAKFMFFKWGHYFIGSEEFYNFSEWELPERLKSIKEKLDSMSQFERGFYILDRVVIMNLVTEISNFHRMRVITTEEKNLIKDELKEHLKILENNMKGDSDSDIGIVPSGKLDFYASNLDIGVTCMCYGADNYHFASTQMNFCHAVISNNYDSFRHVKDWLVSLRSISVLLSGSGHIERRLFFGEQNYIIDAILG